MSNGKKKELGELQPFSCNTINIAFRGAQKPLALIHETQRRRARLCMIVCLFFSLLLIFFVRTFIMVAKYAMILFIYGIEFFLIWS